jgi:hypothetical protein
MRQFLDLALLDKEGCRPGQGRIKASWKGLPCGEGAPSLVR